MKKILVLLVAILCIACEPDFKDQQVKELMVHGDKASEVLKEQLSAEEYSIYKKNGKIILKEKGMVYLMDLTIEDVIDY